MLATTNSILQHSPGSTMSNSNWPCTIRGEESTDTSWCRQVCKVERTAGVHCAHTLKHRCRQNCYLASCINHKFNFDVMAHPVRNQGAADPIAPTTIAAPDSGIFKATSGSYLSFDLRCSVSSAGAGFSTNGPACPLNLSHDFDCSIGSDPG